MNTSRTLLLVACLVASACGGSMSSQDYFTALQDRNRSLNERAQEARSEAQVALTNSTTPARAKAALQAFLKELNSIGDEALTSLEQLDPPEELRSAHDAYLRETRALTGALLAYQEAAARAKPAEIEGSAASARATVEARSVAVEAACTELQGEADGAGIDVDLSCDQGAAPEAPAS